MKGAALHRGEAFGDQLLAAVDQAGMLGPVLQRALGNFVVIRFVGLTEVGGVGERDRAFGAHPVKRGAGVEAAGECDADALADRNTLKNI